MKPYLKLFILALFPLGMLQPSFAEEPLPPDDAFKLKVSFKDSRKTSRSPGIKAALFLLAQAGRATLWMVMLRTCRRVCWCCPAACDC